MEGRAVEILLIEDNQGDIDLIRKAMRDYEVRNNLHMVRDGGEALDFLRRTGKHPASPRPDLILLDLNLPVKSGREVLAEIKNDETFRRIPVVVLSSSKSEEDIATCYDLQANCFITKPAGIDDLMKVVKAIEDFWLDIARLPSGDNI